jgi:ferredoxin-NADP reductase
VLFTGNDQLDYRAGHFLTIDPHQFGALERFADYLENVKGKREPPRAYSLGSAPHERYISVSVKEERYVPGQSKYPPLLSPLLVRGTPRGTRMVVTGFTGPYTLPDDVESQADHIVHVVAGSGAVPNFAILKDALHRGLNLWHTFICANKTFEDIFYRAQLETLAREYPEKLLVVHALSREPEGRILSPNVRRGRITDALLREFVPDPASCLVYACGPGISPWERKEARARGQEPRPRFLESCLAMLERRGIPAGRVRHESWG